MQSSSIVLTRELVRRGRGSAVKREEHGTIGAKALEVEAATEEPGESWRAEVLENLIRGELEAERCDRVVLEGMADPLRLPFHALVGFVAVKGLKDDRGWT